MTNIAIALAFAAAVFATGALIIAVFGRRARSAGGARDLWRMYGNTAVFSAAILLPAALHPALFALLAAVLATRCSVELMAIHDMRASTAGTLALGTLMLAATWAGAQQGTSDTTFLMLGSMVILAFTLPVFWQALAGSAQGASIRIAATVFPALAAAHLCHLVFRVDGALWIFLLYVTVEMQDSFAALFGRLFGRTPLAPRLSPHKTVEGTLAGAGFGLVAGTAIATLLLEFSPTRAAAIAALLVVAGFAGDLFASRLKRVAGVKDFPPVHALHSGLLDIYDSTLFAALPFSVALLWFVPAP